MPPVSLLVTAVPHEPRFSAWTLVALMLVLAASAAVLGLLIRRYTAGRQRERAAAWSATWGGRADRSLPAWLGGSGVAMTVLHGWRSPDRWVVRVRAARTPASRQPDAASVWTLAAVRADLPGPPAALRPSARRSLIDFFSVAGERRPDAGPAVRLLSYPSLDVLEGPADAFTCFAESDEAARALAVSGVAAHLSPAMGLLVREGWVVVDATGADREGQWAAALERGLAAAVAAAACLQRIPSR